MNQDPSSVHQSVKNARQLLNLTEPFSYEDLLNHYHEACRKWNPARYAGHTNNPGKYMQMYKKGETKTKEIQLAFELLQRFLETQITAKRHE